MGRERIWITDLVVFGALAGCGTEFTLRDGPTYQPPVADPVVMEQAARSDGFAQLHRDLSLSCSTAPSDLEAGCTLHRWTADGSELVDVGGVHGAYRLDDDTTVAVTEDLRLLRFDDGGEPEVLVRGAADLRVADDGRRVTYARFDGEPEYLEPGWPVTWMVHDLETNTVTELSSDARDVAPFPVPGSSDILFLSTRSGVASFWLAQANAAPRQLTNVGMTEVGPGFVPVPGRELVWLEDGVTAVFSAHYGDKDIWALDITTGEARRLGPGRSPHFTADGDLVVIDDRDPARPRVVSLGGAL